jgi:integrase
LETAEREGENPKAVAALRLIALTGCRRAEIAALRRHEADEAHRCLRLSDSKEGASVRPIGKPAFDVIRRITRGSESEFVLPGDRSEENYTGLPKAWMRIRARAKGLPAGLTLHGLRHAFSSVANELGYTEATCAALLGHAGSRSQTGDYTHHLDNVLIAAADRVSQKIHAMMSGERAEVVRLPVGHVGRR